MAILIRICVFLILFGIGDTKEWTPTPEIYAKGENVTVRIDPLHIKGKQNLEITFSGYTSKLHVTNVMLFNNPRDNHTDKISINRNYTGRIQMIEMNNGSLSFHLLNVNFMDSGLYTVSTLEGSMEKGKTSILVPRTVICVQDSGSLIVQFTCNKTNISSITIQMMKPTNHPVVIYDVEQATCTLGDLYKNRVESCVLNVHSFSLTLQKVSWLDKGTYVALDDKKFLLDSVIIDIEEFTRTSRLETTKVYATFPSTANAKQNDFTSRSHVQGDNGNAIIGELVPAVSWSSEINASIYSSMLHVTNVMLIDPKKDKHDSGSVKINYTGLIQMIAINKDSLSFQLLNVTFVQSGEFKGLEHSCENRSANILVLRRKFVHQDGESGTRVLMCNNTNMSSIKTDIMQTNVSSLMVVYNVTHGNCTFVAHKYTAWIQGCVFSGNNVSFIFREGSWLKGATFSAYNVSGFLLDLIFIDVQGSSLETRNKYQTSSTGAMFAHVPPNSNEKPTLLFVSAVVVIVVAACLAMIAFRKIRHRRVPNTETNCIKYRNRGKTSANSSRNLYQNVQEAISPEETRMVSAKNNDAVNLTDKSNNKGQVKVRLKEDNLYHRRFDYADCSTRTTRNLQIDSTAHLYDYIHENHDRCWSYESNLRSRPNSTGCIAEPCFVYDYVVQHSFMTLRPPAPDPVLTKDRGTRADSISWYKRLNIKSAFRVDPITLYEEINQKTSRESNCTVSSPEAGSRDFINQLAPSSYFELEGIRTTDTMNSPSWLTYGISPNLRNVENLNSSNFVPRLELSELRVDCFASAKSKSRRVAQFSNYDYPRSYFDHPSAMDRRHRRSQSLSDMMAIASVRWSRRRSARACMKKYCYDSL